MDNILHQIAYSMDDPKAEYWNPKNREQLQIKPFIKGISRWDEKSKSKKFIAGLPAYNEKHNIGYSSIIRNACLSIFEITSDCGIHELSKAIDISSLGLSDISIYKKNITKPTM